MKYFSFVIICSSYYFKWWCNSNSKNTFPNFRNNNLQGQKTSWTHCYFYTEIVIGTGLCQKWRWCYFTFLKSQSILIFNIPIVLQHTRLFICLLGFTCFNVIGFFLEFLSSSDVIVIQFLKYNFVSRYLFFNLLLHNKYQKNKLHIWINNKYSYTVYY